MLTRAETSKKRRNGNMKGVCVVGCILVLVLASFTSSLSAAETGNLLVNPGFEKVEPFGWDMYGDSVPATDTFKSGEQSGKVWAWDFGDGVFEQFVDVIPGNKYKASVYMLSKSDDAISDGSKAWIQIEWCFGNNEVKGEAVKSPSLDGASDSWKLFETPVVAAPEGAVKAKVKIMIQAPKKEVKGGCYIDDADFRVVPKT